MTSRASCEPCLGGLLRLAFVPGVQLEGRLANFGHLALSPSTSLMKRLMKHAGTRVPNEVWYAASKLEGRLDWKC